MSALPSLRQLRYLVALTERLNFRQAAEDCFVTQSTLSAGIRELEELLGVRLLERDRRSVRVTPVGAEIAARSRSLVAGAQELVDLARSQRAPLTGTLRLGVIPTIAPFLLPQVLPELRTRYPRLKLYLREDLTERLLVRLRSAALDAALIALPFDTGELAVTELFRDEFWYVTRASDPAARARSVAVEKLNVGQILLLEEGHCLRDHAIAACGARRGAEEPLLEATSLSTLLQMVEGGLGVTLLPEMTLRAGILNGTTLVARPFATEVPARNIALVSRPSSARKRDLEIVARFVAERGQRATPAGIPAHRSRRRV